MGLTAEVQAKYTLMIDSILAASDLNSITAKRIRKGLQAALDYDITPEKDDINELIMARFDKLNAERKDSATTNGIKSESDDARAPISEAGKPVKTERPGPASDNGVPVESIEKGVDQFTAGSGRKRSTSPSLSSKKREATTESDDLSDLVDSGPPTKKRRRKVVSAEDDDAAYAARLQAEENHRARPTRGGATKKRTLVKPKKSSKAKSVKKIRVEDDSDLEDGSETERKVNRSGGFHKPMTLSEPLSQLLGESTLSRPQTVKKIWEYVKARDLQDPNDRRQIRCDEPMRAVFKQDRVHMFTMNKILNQNLYVLDE